MIRPCTDDDLAAIFAIINDAAQAYKGVIPADRWSEPYMSEDELGREISEGVVFWGWEENGELIGVMGIQPVQDVTLIRHAYVRTARRNQGVGAALLADLHGRAETPMLIGTWAAAIWAIRFYEKRGFRRVPVDQIVPLLERYWSVPARQAETSVVLADEAWFARES
jgi:N-acetylglutamate synthase-like GNAT family acetyltransferase